MENTLPTDADLLAKIEKFCTDKKLPPTTFGRLAIGDGNLVANLRSNRSLTLKSANRVVDFMATYTPQDAAA